MTISGLFKPLKIKNVTIKNRIMCTAHLTNFGSLEGMPTGKMVAYHETRARGGVGLIITESMAVAPESAQSQYTVRLYEDKVIPGLTELTSRVKVHGAVIFAQLHHMGSAMTSTDTMLPIVAPSPIPDPGKREIPHELTVREIKQVVQRFADAAKRCIAAGYDGVEVHLAHGYLPHEFISNFYNKRNDEYGGSFENRLRFPREVIRAVRKAIPDHVVGIRINGDEYVDGGLTQKDYQEICKKLAEEKIDYIGLSVGHAFNYPPCFPSMDFPLGFAVYLASGIKRIVDIPVYTSHRINDPLLAEKILDEGHADIIGMTRAIIADPDMPYKAMQGSFDDIRPCVGCLQGCFHRLKLRAPISCFGNAQVGREMDLVVKPAEKKKKVVVVGGGPAGLEAARVLAERGHEVTIYEKEVELGGFLRRGSFDIPNRQELFGVCRWQIRQVERLGVSIRLQHEFTVNDLKENGFQVVVMATGGFYGKPDFPFFPDVPHLNLLQTLDLGDEEVAGKNIIIIDREYHNKALGLAEKFAQTGARVIVFTEETEPGVELDPINKSMILSRLNGLGIKFISKGVFTKNENGSVSVFHEGWAVDIGEPDYIILIEKPKANNQLAKVIEMDCPDVELYLIGNCAAPRLTPQAIYDGYRVGLAI
jgi:2,4-dienoyl-CoA reductase-like NADH-dependent reductase (Old Yellow Enzyme family)